VLLKPRFQLGAARPASGEIEEQGLLFVNSCAKLNAVQCEEHFHGGVGNAFVAIYKRVVERLRQRGRLGGYCGVQIHAIERGAWLGDGGFEHWQVAKAWRSAGAFDDRPVQGDDLTERQIPHQASRR
jgi:hypothetical protein